MYSYCFFKSHSLITKTNSLESLNTKKSEQSNIHVILHLRKVSKALTIF